MATHETSASHKGACHCGAVQFEAALSDGLHTVRRCDCSICRMRGAIVAFAPSEDVKITNGEDNLTLYQFNTKEAKHYFCKVCGIYTHHQTRTNPDIVAVNVACLEGVSPFDFAEVQVQDGVNHVKDTGQSNWAGVLRFERGLK